MMPADLVRLRPIRTLLLPAAALAGLIAMLLIPVPAQASSPPVNTAGRTFEWFVNIPAQAESAASVATPEHAAFSVNTFEPRGWNGKCYTNWHTNEMVNMWCDGKGPERYGVSVVCTAGSEAYQYNSADHPWFGDRRGAIVACKKGTVTMWWGYPVD